MKIEKIHLFYFSPTRTTRTCLRNIAKGFHDIAIEEHDWSLPQGREDVFEIPDDELAIVGMPVYGGRVPVLFQSALPIKGSGPVVCVVLYGNRHYDDALLELSNLAESSCLRPVAAAAFIAQHSLNPRMGAGRPDAEDIRQQVVFGEQIAHKLTCETSGQAMNISVKGSEPYKEFKSTPFAPDLIHAKRCISCGVCASGCPVQVISHENYRLQDSKVCIFCFRCVGDCPEDVRGLSFIPNTLFQRKMQELAKLNKERRAPEIFL